MILSLALVAGIVPGLMAQPGELVPQPGFECAHAKSAVRQWAAAGHAPPAATLAVNEDTDVLHYHLDIELQPDIAWLGGSNTMTVRSLVDGLSEFHFRLQDVFTIGTVEVGGVPATWNRLDDATIAVTLSPAYDTDEVFELYVAYQGFPAPPPDGFGSVVFRTRNGADEIWTLSEPWFAYTWWPAKDDSTDKTTADLWFTVPDDMEVASNGVRLGVDPLSGGRQRFRWQTQYQTADYLYCIGATNYNTFEGLWKYDGGSMPLMFYIYPEQDNPANRNAWLQNLDMLDVFSESYGVYPFADEKYGMCQVGFGGGMEHQTMTSQGGFWEYITAHELGHQWWGDMVTCATWHDIWLNEGFATYSEALWFGNKPGSAGMEDYHAWMDVRRPSQVGDSVYVYDDTNVARIFSSNFSYRKAAWVLHMLRHVVGDETFFNILGAYRDAFQYDSAITEDFRAVAENVYGQDLAWFFDEWIYGIGAPQYGYAWQQHAVAGRHYVEVYIKQVQTTSYPTFLMPIDAVLTGPPGGLQHVLWNDAAAEHLLFESPTSVSGLTLDPDDWILHTGIAQIGFVQGPPKIVQTSPEPGAVLAPEAVGAITIVFHKDVVINAIDISLEGTLIGAVPFTFEYDSGTQTAALTPNGALPADSYTVSVSDSVADVLAGLALDGEVGNPIEPQSLPSGDGLPGGSAVFSFVVAACDTDLSGDELVNAADLALLLGAWGPNPGHAADINIDGVVNAQDLALLLGSWGPCP